MVYSHRAFKLCEGGVSLVTSSLIALDKLAAEVDACRFAPNLCCKDDFSDIREKQIYEDSCGVNSSWCDTKTKIGNESWEWGNESIHEAIELIYEAQSAKSLRLLEAS